MLTTLLIIDSLFWILSACMYSKRISANANMITSLIEGIIVCLHIWAIYYINYH